jgi:hypothetical protein
MKTKLISTVLVIMIILSGCKQAATPTPLGATEVLMPTDTTKPENDDTQLVLKTAMGDFLIVAARFVDEVNGVKPEGGEEILLVILSRPGMEQLEPSTFPLETFDKMIHDTTSGEIYILGNDESRTISTMGGWVNGEFAMGFRLPSTATTLKLFWPGNPPIDIAPEDFKS